MVIKQIQMLKIKSNEFLCLMVLLVLLERTEGAYVTFLNAFQKLG